MTIKHWYQSVACGQRLEVGAGYIKPKKRQCAGVVLALVLEHRPPESSLGIRSVNVPDGAFQMASNNGHKVIISQGLKVMKISGHAKPLFCRDENQPQSLQGI